VPWVSTRRSLRAALAVMGAHHDVGMAADIYFVTAMHREIGAMTIASKYKRRRPSVVEDHGGAVAVARSPQ